MNKHFFYLLFLLVFFFSPLSIATAKMPDVSADYQSFDFPSGEYILSGNVVIRSPKWTATADYIRIHPLTLKLNANGNVRFSLRGIQMSADHADFTPASQTVSLQGNLQISYGEAQVRAAQGVYRMDTSTADLSGGTILSYPDSGIFIKSDTMLFSLNHYEITFPSPIKFKLYQPSTDSGIEGVAAHGSFYVLEKKAFLSSVTYRTLPDGAEQTANNLQYSCK